MNRQTETVRSDWMADARRWERGTQNACRTERRYQRVSTSDHLAGQWLGAALLWADNSGWKLRFALLLPKNEYIRKPFPNCMALSRTSVVVQCVRKCACVCACVLYTHISLHISINVCYLLPLNMCLVLNFKYFPTVWRVKGLRAQRANGNRLRLLRLIVGHEYSNVISMTISPTLAICNKHICNYGEIA